MSDPTTEERNTTSVVAAEFSDWLSIVSYDQKIKTIATTTTNNQTDIYGFETFTQTDKHELHHYSPVFVHTLVVSIQSPFKISIHVVSYCRL